MTTSAQSESPGGSKPMRADARRNCERILAVAKEVFTAQGTDAPLDEIAKRAKVGAGTLYRHFPNRDALIEGVYRAEIVALSNRAYELLARLPADQALEAWIREEVGWINHQRGLAMSLKAAVDQNSEVFQYCRTVMRDAAGALLGPLQEAGRVRADITPADLLRLGHGIAVTIENQPPEQAERLLSVLIAGLTQGQIRN